MTSKEKAKELVDMYYSLNSESNALDWCTEIPIEVAKRCAIMCVNQIIESSPSLPILSENGTYGSDIEESANYWQEVKTEIEKL